MTAAFKSQCISIAGAPPIDFHFEGDTCRAELAGAKLYAEATSNDGADLRITAADGFVLVDVRVRPRAGRDLTENLTDIGSALLWSHWRHEQAKTATTP